MLDRDEPIAARSPSRRRSRLRLGLGVVGGLCSLGALVACVGGGGMLGPAYPMNFDTQAVQLPPVRGASAVPLRAFLVLDGSVADDDALSSALRDCADGKDVVGALPLVPAVLEASPGGAVVVAGKPVGTLDASGRIPAGELEGMLHARTYDALLDLAEQTKELGAIGCTPALHPEGSEGFQGRLLLVLDERLPFETALSLAYTAGQAQFSELSFVVADPDAPQDASFGRRAPASPTDQALRVGASPTVFIQQGGFRVSVMDLPETHQIQVPCEGAACGTADGWPYPDLQSKLAFLQTAEDAGTSTIVVPESGASWGLVARTLAATSRGTDGAALFPDPILAGGSAVDDAAMDFAIPPATRSESLAWTAEDRLSVVTASLPTLGPDTTASPKLLAKAAELSGAGPLPASEEEPQVAETPASNDLGRGSFGSPPPPTRLVSAGEPVVKGAMDQGLVEKVIKRHMNQIRYCYQRALTKQPTLEGKMLVQFVIAKDGSVSSAATKSSTVGDASVESCIVGRFMRMQFPQPKGGGIVVVSYPFAFAPK